MDADVYGPSIPHLFGSRERPRMLDNRIQPVEVDGLKVMSMGLLVPPGEAVISRGPMLHTALTQFLRDTDWGDLDYLIIDMPPGTGDMAIVAFAIAAADRGGGGLHAAGRGAAGRRQGGRHVPQGEHRRAGDGREHELLHLPATATPGTKSSAPAARRRKAEELGVPFLGELPLVTALAEMADEGRIAAAYEHEGARPYLQTICRTLVKNLAASTSRNRFCRR